MPLFPYQEIDPIDYAAIPKDSNPELRFAPGPDPDLVDQLRNRTTVFLVYASLAAIATGLLFPVTLSILLAIQLVAVVLLAEISKQMGIHFADLLCLNKQIDKKQSEQIRAALTQLRQNKPVFQVIVVAIVFFSVYTICFLNFPDERYWLLPAIMALATIAASIPTIRFLFNRSKRQSLIDLFLNWATPDYPVEIPYTHHPKMRYSPRLTWLCLIIVLFLFAAPRLAFYNPVIFFLYQPEILSQHHPLPEDEFSRLYWAEHPGVYSNLEKITTFAEQSASEREELANSQRVDPQRRALVQSNFERVRSYRQFQLDQTRRSPIGWFWASCDIVGEQPFKAMLPWLFSLLISMLQSLLLVAGIVSFVSVRVVEFARAEIAKAAVYDSPWEGIVDRLVHSEDKYENDSLFLGVFGDD